MIGQPIRLLPFQKKFILDIYDNPHGTDTAILSIARKNAKTATIACIVLAHLVGPEAIQNSRIISGALSREQAAEVYNYASKMINLSPALSGLCSAIPSNKRLVGLAMNVEYQAISAEAKTAHGKSPVVAILDEIGQIRGAQNDFVDAITTAQAAYKDALLIGISTQAPNDSDLFSIWIDDALNNKPPKTVCHLYAADESADVLDEKAWRDSNPALGKFRSLEDMKKQAGKAARMPSFENTFRNLNLNQRVAAVSPFISKSAWEACNAEPYSLEECSEIYAGFDLSAKTDLTALVLYGYHEESRSWNVHPFAWTPAEGLFDRAKMDRAPYDVWVRDGHLFTTPGVTIEYEWVAYTSAEIFEPIMDRLKGVGFDRWRMDLLRKEFDRIGVSLPLVDIGQGFKDMAPAVENLESKILHKKIRHGGHPVLNMAASNTVVSKNPTGDRKPDKMKTTGRIDPFVALLIAEATAGKMYEDEIDIDGFLNDPLIF